MTARRLLDWYAPALLSAAAAAVLAVGFVLGLRGGFGEPLAPLPVQAAAPRPDGAYRVVALGDSITEGVGDPTGGGYASRVCQGLRRAGRTVLCTNLAVSGAETAEVLALARKPEARRQIAAADVVLVSAGGNDLSHTLRDDSTGQASLSHARDNLATLVRELRAANPRAAIRLLGLYNPFEVQPGELPRARAQLLAWNVAIEEAAQPVDDALVIPVADLFAGWGERLAGDRYHPGSTGHALIAERVLTSLPAAAR